VRNDRKFGHLFGDTPMSEDYVADLIAVRGALVGWGKLERKATAEAQP